MKLEIDDSLVPKIDVIDVDEKEVPELLAIAFYKYHFDELLINLYEAVEGCLIGMKKSNL